ncbi:MAG TPA: molybdopterin converting factor subunit 1 [Solirubrobacteraceae bacterium]|nr:molybdopterin converting factor subunit 1 [Solirubrobacteraceae bacterium]
MSAAPTGEGLEVRVRLFAMLRERAGRDSVQLTLDHGATVADAITALGAREELRELLQRLPVRMAVNREYADTDTVLQAGDELALIPPVSGGSSPSGRVHARVSAEPLSAGELERVVADPDAGALVTFQGVTRSVDRLEYEAYAEMAEQKLAALAQRCLDEHGLRRIAVEHRVGTVPRGEPSVVVAVSAAHREEAFAGARAAIDRLKQELPIWKREGPGASDWVTGG